MAEKTVTHAAPYASFPSFLSFINKLRENGVPSRIDPSVFGNASGSISYSVIAALKSLKLINEDGTPSAQFDSFVKAADEDRKPMLVKILRAGYPSLWGGTIDLTTASAGQFDEHLRNIYEAKGSTVDKAAAFFIAAANLAGEPISPHLKARKPVASSALSKKSAKQRKPGGDETDQENGGEGTPKVKLPLNPAVQKELEYQLIDLMAEADIDEEVKKAIWALVQYLAARKVKKAAATNDATAS